MLSFGNSFCLKNVKWFMSIIFIVIGFMMIDRQNFDFCWFCSKIVMRGKVMEATAYAFDFH